MRSAILFFKASLPPGARWITVRPNGPGTDGHPVLIQPAGDGSMRVIGGAGGKLNYLKLTGVRSEADYKADAAKAAQVRKETKKRQAAADKEAGLTESKGRVREALKAELGQHQAKFIETVADTMGWSADEMRFPEEKHQNLTPAALKKAAADHGKALLRRAHEAVEFQRQRLLNDADARAEAGLGEVPLVAKDPAELTVQDLDPIEPNTKGLGFAPEYGKRAEERGLTGAELKAEGEAARPPPEKPPAEGEPTPKERRKAAADAIAGELKTIRDPGPKVDPQAVVDAKKAMDLLKAEKALREVRKEVSKKRALVDAAKEPVEPQAFVIEVGNSAPDADITRGLESDFRTLRTRAFLEEVGRQPGGLAPLGRHVAVGAFNSVNSLALAAGGAALVDRSVVDVLGVAGAARVLARRLAQDLTPAELEDVKGAMGTFHTDHYMRLSDQALREARSWHEMAAEIELGEGTTTGDLRVMQELNAKRREFTGKAQQVLGTALGEMEANAALVVALEAPMRNPPISLGATSPENAIRQARAIGLDRGDYQVQKIGATTFLTVTDAGMDKLAAPVSREDMEATARSLAILSGREDEDGWLPDGVARRPELSMNDTPGVAPRIAKPFKMGEGGAAEAIRDYIGGRAADGDTPAEIMSGLLAEDTLRAAGDRGAYMQALEELAPLYGADGKMVRAESHQAAFDKMADDYVAKLGGDRTPLHRQDFPVDQVAVDSLHAALARTPEGVAAFKPVGDLSPQDQAGLRGVFAREYAKMDPDAERLQGELRELDAAEPEKETDGLFGKAQNPEWAEWRQRRDAAAEAANKATMTWGKYIQVMGSPTAAYQAMQDVVRSSVLKDFADHHNRARKDAPLRIGRTAIAGDLNHLDALDPAARETRLAKQRDLADSLRNRVAGRYASGSVADKMAAARAAEEAAAQSQMGLFGAEELPSSGGADETAPETAPELGERYTIGHAAERQIASMMPIVGHNFRPGQPTPLWSPTMSGKYVGRQRAVKLNAANKRTILAAGVGSGKTAIMLSAFTHNREHGGPKRGLFAVPSVVQGQFHGEALTLLEAGKYQWHCQPGASRDERIAGYKDPANHFSVVTHQALRDDMVHLMAEHGGLTEAEATARFTAMKPAERATFLRGVLDKAGIDHRALAVDEGHNLLNRAGKEDSLLANVVDALSAGMDTYINASADPVKNDASEAFDLLAKMDPGKYTDRDAFMRRYGVDTGASRQALQREMARYMYTGQVDPGIKANKSEVKVDLSPSEHSELSEIDRAAGAARLARMHGKVDVDALKRLSPHSFDGLDEAQSAAAAAQLNRSIGILRDSAAMHVVNGKSKIEALAREAGARRGKPGVIFARRRTRVAEIADRLQRDGHKVLTLTGSDSSAEKDKIKRAFKADPNTILVASDAAAVGANLQTGKWLAQLDTPDTAMLHRQRQGRIDRVGQTEDVELLDMVADHPEERRARKRLGDKYQLRDIMTSPLEGLDETGIAGYINKARAGQKEAQAPLFMPTPDGQAPEGLAAPDEQQSLF